MDHTIILSGAIVSHQSWMTALQMYVKGGSTLSDVQVSSSSDCALGKWLKGDGAAEFSQWSEFNELLELHQKLHTLGAEVVKSKHKGDAAAAEKLIETIVPMSKKIVVVIEKLKTKIT